MTAPAPGLPEDVERALTEAITRAASIGYDGAPDDKYFGGEALDVALDRAMDSDKVTALRAAILAAMRAATEGSGAASAASAASAAHVAPGGEPVAWAVVNPKMSGRILFCDERAARNAARMDGDAVEPLYIRPSPMDAGAVERARVAAWEAAHDSLRDDVLHNADGFDNDIVNHFLGMIDDADQRPYDHIAAHVAPPVSESFDAARDKVVDAAVRWHAAPSYDNASATALLGAVEDYNATRRAEGDSTTKGGARE